MGTIERNLNFTTAVAYEITSSVWAIKNFRLVCALDENMKKATMVFNAGESIGLSSRWKVCFSKTAKNFGIYLCMLKPPEGKTSVFGRFRYIISTDDEVFQFPGINWGDLPKMFTMNTMWGCEPALQLQELSKPSPSSNESFPSNGDLIIRIQVILFNDEFPATAEKIQPESLNKKSLLRLHSDLQGLLESEENSDVEIKTRDGKTLKAHKAILTARSPVFAAMFKHEMKENSSGVVSVDDLTFGAMKTLLNFIYTGKLDKEWVENIAEVIYAATKYALPLLKEYCDAELETICTPENAWQLRNHARLHGLKKAEKAIVEYIRVNFDQVMAKTH